MRIKSLLLTTLMCLIFPFCSYAFNAIEMDRILSEIKAEKLDVFATSLDEYIDYCTSKLPGLPEVEQYAIDRYALAVNSELNICRLKIEAKLKNNPQLLAEFQGMFKKYVDFVDSYANVATNFMMADFESGTIEYASMFKNVPRCSATRARYQMLCVFKRFLDKADGHELRTLFGDGPIGGPTKRAQMTFRKLHD